VKPANFIYPLFVFTKDTNEPISSMPGALRHTRASVMKEVRNPYPETLKPQSLILNTQHSTLNTQHSTLNTQHST